MSRVAAAGIIAAGCLRFWEDAFGGCAIGAFADADRCDGFIEGDEGCSRGVEDAGPSLWFAKRCFMFWYSVCRTSPIEWQSAGWAFCHAYTWLHACADPALAHAEVVLLASCMSVLRLTGSMQHLDSCKKASHDLNAAMIMKMVM